MLNDVKKRLESFGYKIQPNDDFALGFCIGKVGNQIKNFCNIEEIPEELNFAYIDMVCSEFLLGKKSTGNLTLNDIDLNSPAIKSISEGDTSVNFYVEGNQTAEQKLDNFIMYLSDKYKMNLYKYRRFTW